MKRVKKIILILLVPFIIYISYIVYRVKSNVNYFGSFGLLTAYIFYPVEESEPFEKLIAPSLIPMLALQELKDMEPDDKMKQMSIKYAIISTEDYALGEKNPLKSKKAYKKAVYFLRYLYKKDISFYYTKDFPCSELQASLFLLIHRTKEGYLAFRDSTTLKADLLNIYLLTEEERNKKDINSEKVYCRKSVNEYLQDKEIKDALGTVDIQYIIDDLER